MSRPPHPLRPHRPPRLAEALLARSIDDAVAREGALGDLREEFEELHTTRSSGAARRWYWLAALRLGLAYRQARSHPPATSPTHAPRRGEPLMHTLMQDLRFALRTLAKSYGFTAIAVLTLAFGIGATTAMFGVLHAAFLRPLPFAEPERLVLGRATFDGRINSVMSAYDFFDYREQADTLQSFSAFAGFTRAMSITGFDEAERVDGIWVSWDLFRTLGIDPQAGRHMSRSEGEPGGDDVALVSDRFARGHWGSPEAAVGELLRIDGNPTRVVGVMPADFFFVFDVDLWLPMRRDGPFANARRFHNWTAVGRLAAGVALPEAQSQADAISVRLEAEYPESNQGKAMLLSPLHEVLVEGQRVSLWLLMAAVSLVLLIACGNVANLLLARGAARRPELAVRAALGASRGRLVRQLLTESVVVALVAGVAGLFLAVWLQGIILRLMPLTRLGIDAVGLSPAVLGFALLAALATSLLFGTLPAIQAAPVDVAQHLKAAGRTTEARRSARLRSTLVVAQVSVSVVLLIGAGLMVRSLAGLAGSPLGFAPENLVTAELLLTEADYPEGEQVRLFYADLIERVRAIPGVLGAGMISQLPIRDPGNNIYVYDADNPPADTGGTTSAHTRNIMPGYFEAMRIPLLAGRTIEPADTASTPPVMVIDEALAAELFPGQDAIGRRIVIDYGQPVTAEVVGVVGSVKVNSLRGTGSTMYFPFAQMTSRTMRLAMRTAAGDGAAVAALRDVVRRIDPNLPLADLVTMESLIDQSLASDRAVTGSLALFAAVALALAVVGLYGVLAYYVAQRRREIGLRLAIGAPRGRILVWVLRRGLGLVAVGLLFGVAGAWAASRFIAALLYGVGGTDPVTFAGVSLLLVLVALLACLVPAWRATRVDPIVALSAG
jgi:putative ABC transport system permease protein